jgi:hypothetical protein
MKKIVLMMMVLALMMGLSGCKSKPFDDEEGYVLEETNELVYTYYNGFIDQRLFEYVFLDELYVYVKEDSSVYNFTNINNYVVVSDNIKALLESFDDVIYNETLLENFDDSIELSLGASVDDFNMIDVDLEGDTYQVDAMITYDNGVNIVVSYHDIIVDGEHYFIPSYIQFYTVDIHKEVSWEYLGEDNEYDKDPVKVIRYETLIVPVPPRTGADNPFSDLVSDDIEEVGYYTRVIGLEEDYEEEILCVDGVTEDCVEVSYTEISVQIYYATFDDVLLFYETNYSAAYDGDNFTFYNLGYRFNMYDIEEVSVRDDNDEIIDVVNAVIRIYEVE